MPVAVDILWKLKINKIWKEKSIQELKRENEKKLSLY